MAYSQCFPIVSCDCNGDWLPDDVESKYEALFMSLLHECQSYEDFCMKSDLALAEYNLGYFGFGSKDELHQFVKDYYSGGMHAVND